ncbi:MAG: oligoribonuclease [Sandaracinus sp.]|nr:oligoribonuclease [Myxococcales bacterium]MCB9600471.1 oligoribonuclease [Sandaracinus sp.]MCB9615240.1 oligoribonuclease [Sandaracinus sp.]MCB9620968.1 oligoribonuclease [Sandaracinus sp.]MCB9625233.1 oligoribonuclease [Sandaracinus sp.]
MPSDANLVWIDMEMSGLDADRERILEIAVLVTDGELNVIAEGPNLVIHQSEELLAGMDEWNTKHHGASGLTKRVRESTVDEAVAEAAVVGFLKEHCQPKAAPLAGNSVHQDRRFIARYMPVLDAFLHYRIVDVSTIKELGRRWFPKEHDARPQKRAQHRAMDDIRESLEELKYYRKAFFKEV